MILWEGHTEVARDGGVLRPPIKDGAGGDPGVPSAYHDIKHSG